jgi:hypothetical protein
MLIFKVGVAILFAGWVSVLSDVGTSSQLYKDIQDWVKADKDITVKNNKTCKPSKDAPWIYRDDFNRYVASENIDWFKVYDMNESNTLELQERANIVPTPRLFNIPDEILFRKWNISTERDEDACSSYVNCSLTQVLDDLLGYKAAFQRRKITAFHNVWVDSRGLVVERKSCKAVRNGACPPSDSDFEHKKMIKFTPYPLVISLATSWKGTWHFPMEDVVALANIDKEILDKVVFHVPIITTFITSWLKLLGIPDSRIVTDTIECQVLLIPQMRCGKPYYSQLQWMRHVYLPVEMDEQDKVLGSGLPLLGGANATATATAGAVSGDKGDKGDNSTVVAVSSRPSVTSNAPLQVLLIERHHARGVTNTKEVHNTMKTMTEALGMRLVVHSDQHMPPLIDQMKLFAKSDVIIAPHGAGLMFTTFAPHTSCIVEFSHPNSPFCYAHIAYVRNMSYLMYDMRDNHMNINSVKDGFKRCVEAVKYNKQHAHTHYTYDPAHPYPGPPDAAKLSSSSSSNDGKGVAGLAQTLLKSLSDLNNVVT